MKFFCQGRHCVWRLTHREFHAFLIKKWHFPLLSMTNEIVITSLKCRFEHKFQFLWLPILTLSNLISCSLHNIQGIVLKFSHMMWIILNFCLTTKNWMLLTLLSVCSKLFTVCVRRFLKYTHTNIYKLQNVKWLERKLEAYVILLLWSISKNVWNRAGSNSRPLYLQSDTHL